MVAFIALVSPACPADPIIYAHATSTHAVNVDTVCAPEGMLESKMIRMPECPVRSRRKGGYVDHESQRYGPSRAR